MEWLIGMLLSVLCGCWTDDTFTMNVSTRVSWFWTYLHSFKQITKEHVMLGWRTTIYWCDLLLMFGLFVLFVALEDLICCSAQTNVANNHLHPMSTKLRGYAVTLAKPMQDRRVELWRLADLLAKTRGDCSSNRGRNLTLSWKFRGWHLRVSRHPNQDYWHMFFFIGKLQIY
jgi:hypothetical protein